MVVALLRGHVPLDEHPGGLEVEHGHEGLEQRRPHPAALAGAVPADEGGEDAEGEVDARGAVGDGMTGAHGALTGQPGHRHQAGHPLGDLVVARPPRPWADLAEPGDAAQHQAGVVSVQGRPVEAEAGGDPRCEVLHDHVGPLRQPQEQGLALGLLEVERE
jgi:hypothetical protein